MTSTLNPEEGVSSLLSYGSRTLYSELPLPTPTSIRLISLFMDPDDDIDCSMKVYELESAPPFAALSYTWGKDNPTFIISCNGFHDIPVAENLNNALKRLVSPSRAMFKASTSTTPDGRPDFWGPECQHFQSGARIRMLWIDALCINQADNKERVQQVRIMDRIYSEAIRVITWLDCPKIDPETFQMLAWASMQYLRWQQSSSINFDEQRLPAPGAEMWKQCLEIYQHVYFERVWIIQEIALARSAVLFIGKYELDWIMLGAAAALLKDKKRYWQPTKPLLPYDPEKNPFAQAVNIFELLVKAEKKGQLLSTLQKFHRCQSTVPVDKVFAILGMIAGPHIQVSYDISKGEVFRQVARAIIQHDNNLDVLSCVPWTQFHEGHVEQGTQSVTDIDIPMGPDGGVFYLRTLIGSTGLDPFQPYREIEEFEGDTPSSWAPYWDITDFGPEVQPINTVRTVYNATANIPLSMSQGDNTELLAIKGIFIDTIETCASVTGDDASFYIAPSNSDFPVKIKKFFDPVFEDPTSPNPLSEDLKWAFAMTMVAGLNQDLKSANEDPSFAEEAARYWETYLGEPFLSIPPVENSESDSKSQEPELSTAPASLSAAASSTHVEPGSAAIHTAGEPRLFRNSHWR